MPSSFRSNKFYYFIGMSQKLPLKIRISNLPFIIAPWEGQRAGILISLESQLSKFLFNSISLTQLIQME